MNRLKFGLLAVALCLAACTDDDGAYRALNAYGFTNIQLTGYEYFGCSDSDQTHTGFTAMNPQGHPVSGVVCCGFMKNCAVRF